MSYPYTPTEKWDVHTHTTLSPNTYEALSRFTHYEEFVRIKAHEAKPCCAQMINSNGNVVREIEDNAYSGETRLTECNKHGVTMQVLSPTPMMIPDYVDNETDAAEICKILNDDNANTVASNPDRFMALGALPMQFPEAAIKEMRRIRDELGFKGIEINSNINGDDLDEAHFFPIFEAAAELDMAIFLHPWGGFMSPTEERLKRRMHADRNWRPWLIAMGMETALAFDAFRCGGIHERLPNLRVLYAHGGGLFPALSGRLEHGAYCRPDIFANSSSMNSYETIARCGVYTDTLTHSPWVLEMLIRLLGCNRIAVGSDYPYPLGEIDPFDAQSMQDPKGNLCPYPRPKTIYPGHLVEHLPGCDADMDAAQDVFHWLPNSTLPIVHEADKQRMLSGTAKEWLGVSS